MKSKNKKNKDIKVRTLIGGQALMEGVMMRGSKSMAMAVRNPSGEIMIEAKRFKNAKSIYRKIPIIRGVIAFLISMVYGVKCLTKSAEISSPEEEAPGSVLMGISVVLGLAIGIGLFILLPSLINSLIIDKFFSSNIILSSVFEGVIRIIIFVGYLLLVSLLNDIKRTFMYHGAEHKTINCYENGMEMTVENVSKCSTVHNRCGTTFLFFVMMISIVVFSLCNLLFLKLGLTVEAFGSVAMAFIKMGIRLALLPLVAGLSYELLRLLAILPDNIFTNILRSPGLALQKLTTKQPTKDMVEIALKSFLEVLDMDNDDEILDIEFGQMRKQSAYELLEKSLSVTDADDSEADWILCDCLKKRRSELRNDFVLTKEQCEALKGIIKRRISGEPLWYILGYTDFYKNRILIDNRVLIPRMETEILCEKAIKEINAHKGEPSVLDLCTGSGCISLAIAKNTTAKITASDISKDALEVASKNLSDFDVKIVQSDMFSGLEGLEFDFIVSNPPYIETSTIQTLEKQVKDFEPHIALDGGEDGLDFYRIISKQAYNYLTDGGKILMEIGYKQAQAVLEIFKPNYKCEILKDYNGHDRVIICHYLEQSPILS